MYLTPEGDLAEVFEQVSQTAKTGVVVRAAHNRALSEDNSYLKEWLPSQPIQMEVAVELAKTKKRTERTATLAIRYAPVKLSACQLSWGVRRLEAKNTSGSEPKTEPKTELT